MSNSPSSPPASVPSALLDAEASSVWKVRLTQTAALFLDAYRELNARKLFWITLALSGVVALLFACVGINEKGPTILHWSLGEAFPFWNTAVISKATFYKWIFSYLAIPLWLAWPAIVLALVSTASVFPEFVSSGSVDLYLSRPLSRLRLFFTKYLTGLLFVALQVFAFTAACFLVIGIRGGSWELGLFLSVPIVTLMFSYLFAISVLLGVLTRSTVAAVLLTLLCWVVFAIVSGSEAQLLAIKTQVEGSVARQERSLKVWDSRLAATRNEAFETQREKVALELENKRGNLSTINRIHSILWAVKFPVPKTAETVDLLRRALVRYAELPGEQFTPGDQDPAMVDAIVPSTAPVTVEERRRANRARESEMRSAQAQVADNRSGLYVVGTSVAFEAVLLAVAALVFVRRDY